MAGQAASRGIDRGGPPPDGAMVVGYRKDQARVRHAAADYARASGLTEDQVQDVVLAVGELAGNTLKHTSGPGTLTMWTAGGELLAQIDDGGHIRTPLRTARPDPPDHTGGQGLWLVHQLCDRVEIRTGPDGTCIRMHIRLPR